MRFIPLKEDENQPQGLQFFPIEESQEPSLVDRFLKAAEPEDPIKRIVAAGIEGLSGLPAGAETMARAIPRQVATGEILEQSQLYQLSRKLFGREPTPEDLQAAQLRKTDIDRYINENIPRIPGLETLAKKGSQVASQIRESVSPEALEALRGSKIEGNLIEAFQNRDFSKITFGNNPTLYGYVLQGADVFGSLFPVIIAASVGASAAAITGGGMAAGEGAKNAVDFVANKTDVELVASSPYYKSLRESNVSELEARQILSDRAAEQAAFLQGSVATIGGAATAKLLSGVGDKILDVAGKRRLGRIALGGTLVGLEEGTQEFLEGVAADIGINKEVVKEIGEDSFANFVLGFIGGAPVGAVRGAVEPLSKDTVEKELEFVPIDEEPPSTQPAIQPAIQPSEEAPGLLPGMEASDEILTPEQEVDFQAFKAASPDIAPIQQVSPVPVDENVAPQLASLNAQLGEIQATRSDPALPIQDAQVMNELDLRESQIVEQIQALTTDQTPVQVSAAPATVAAPDLESVSKKQISPAPVVSLKQPAAQVEAVTQPEITEIASVQQPTIPQQAVQQPEISVQQPTRTVQQPPSIEDEIRVQKAQERGERQAEQEAKKDDFVLQNRDRSGSASLEQMQNIAKAPDYGRAGFSRTPDGAPIVSFANVSQQQLGRQDQVTTASGRKIPIQYAVVEADSVLASNDIQGRTNVDYGNKDVVGTRAIAGNGRITGLREAYKRGTTGQYIQDMTNDSSLHGVSPDAISEMNNPVLVRIMPQDMLTKDIGDDLNKSSMLELSPVEQAKNDLNRVDFDALEFDESGEINQNSLSQFINAQPVEERSRLVDQGLPTKQAQQRLENAIFARAYNDDSLIAMFAQTQDPEAKLVINALAQISPQMAKLEGAGNLDIRDIVTDAAKIIISGKRRNLSLNDIASQIDITVDPDTRIIVELFAQNPRSNKEPIRALKAAADMAYQESIRPAEDLFGEAPKLSRSQIIDQLRRPDEPRRTQDVAQAQRTRTAPSDVEREVEPIPAAVPPADQEFSLTGQTQEELAELERKERTGEAEREQQEREAKEIADRERDVFTLERTRAEPTPVAPPLKPTGDMFGAASQPSRTTATATPIEEVAKKEDKSTVEETKPDLDTLYNIEFDMPEDRQKGLFGSTSEAKKISEAMEPKGKKLPPGRSPELAAAARAVKAGTMTAAEYNALVDKYRPIPIYAEPLKPATSEQVFDALDIKKRKRINPVIPNGTKVGLRLDIPAFNRKGVFVVSIHQKRTASSPGKVIGYGSVAKAKNVTFGLGNQLKALDIATGEAKDALQTIEGEYINISPEQALAEAERAIKDPNYVQIGIDPTRHAYFYDRRTTLPVVSAEEVIQIGNMILAKKPVFGSKSDFLYNIEVSDEKKRDNENNELLKVLQDLRQEEIDLPDRIRDYGTTSEGQRISDNLDKIDQEINKDFNQEKYRAYTADNFILQARKAVEDGSLSADVFSVIQAIYSENPKLLEGLRLDVQQKFSPEEIAQRRAAGKKIPLGAFKPFERLILLYTGTEGVSDPLTIRHEITHTLEQMMTPGQRRAIISSYMKDFRKAIKKHKDARSQDFFDKAIKFLNSPTMESQEAMNSALPSMDFYQFTSPSEYWAVNAEKIMSQRLGTSWERFKKSIRKMVEKMKELFGFENQFVVHDVLDKIMSGSVERMDPRMLSQFIQINNRKYDFLENIQDDQKLIEKYKHGDTPMLDESPAKTMLVRTSKLAKSSLKDMVDNPFEIPRLLINPVLRGITSVRNSLIWFGTGLNEADRIKYNGQVRTSNELATASLALENSIRNGNISLQVLLQGGIEYNPNALQFLAVKKDQNMIKVFEAEAALKLKLGAQLATNLEQRYLEAKRSKSIKQELIARTESYEKLEQQTDAKVKESKALEKDPKSTEQQLKKVDRELKTLFRDLQEEKKDLEVIQMIARDKVKMGDQEIEDFIARDKVHPELKEIIDNFTAVNQNVLKFRRQVGLLSEKRYKSLSGIKDYVPWYRIMNDDEDVHSPLQERAGSATNIGKEKVFGPGKPSVTSNFTVKKNQKTFKVPSPDVDVVKLNTQTLDPKDYSVSLDGEVTLNVPVKIGDTVVVEGLREIDNIIGNMTNNVLRMTMGGLQQYAAQRIVSEYATRGPDGKILTFKKIDPAKGRFEFVRDGRRTVVEIQDPLIAESAFGLQAATMKMWAPLAIAANFTRRTITLSPVFQVRQVFKDAPTAALVTGVKNPAALIGGVYKGFFSALTESDPAVSILRSAGIGGFQSLARTPEADIKRRIGIINNNTFDYAIKALDHIGDASDMAQRIAVYNRVMAETGDQALALNQAANVINFLHHGSSQVARALFQTVPFITAYANSIDVLYNALVGGGLRGLDRKKAMQQLFITGSLLAGSTILYAMLVGDDEDYMKMDDQSKVRNYMLPGTDLILPMNTSAAFFFKAIPELVYNAIVSQGTENEVDEKRLRRAMKEAAVDLLLGPTPVPSAAKPIIEIGLNYDFFTSRPVVPAGLKDLDAYQQYDMRTSEAAKVLSSLTGGKENRLLNPVEADHLIRGIFGTVGGMVAWSSNLIGEGSAYRPEMGLKEMPITGPFLRPEVPRGREDLFYNLKESTDRKFKTYNRLVNRDEKEAEAYFNRHPNLIAYYQYTSQMDTDLKKINAEIRFIGESRDESFTPAMKKEQIQELLEIKQDILEGVERFRKEAYEELQE